METENPARMFYIKLLQLMSKIWILDENLIPLNTHKNISVLFKKLFRSVSRFLKNIKM